MEGLQGLNSTCTDLGISCSNSPKAQPPCVNCTTALQQYLITPTPLCVVVRQQPCNNDVFLRSIWDHVGERTKTKKVQRIRTMLQTQNRKGEQTHPDMTPGPSQRLCWSSPWVETCQNTHTVVEWEKRTRERLDGSTTICMGKNNKSVKCKSVLWHA